ncbi:unnamed protein product [Withania somnifera]
MTDHNKEIVSNRKIDLNKEFDPIQKIDSLERENHLLLMKVNELEATHKAVLEAKETKIRDLKRQLEEQDGRLKSQKDFTAWRSMSWRKDRSKNC